MSGARRPFRAALVAALLAAVAAVFPVLTANSSPAQASADQRRRQVRLLHPVGIYQNAFYPKNLDTQGMAGKLNYLVYAFENIDPTNLTCFEANHAASQDENNPNAGDGAGDQFADYEKTYDASTSVDGVADAWVNRSPATSTSSRS